MTSGEVRVDTSDLTGKAGQIEGLTWPNKGAQPQLIPPDTLQEANTAILNLDNNAQGLWRFQEYGRLEGLRLAETLKLVADAYDRVDFNAMQDINNGGEGTSPPEAPGVNKLPEPPPPTNLAIPEGQLVDDGLLVPDVQTNLLAGDQAASLRAAAAMWRQNAASLATVAEGFEVSSVNWEGEAADAAYRKFDDYRGWLISLSGSWTRLAVEADRVAQAHFNTLSKHQPIYDEYMRLQAEFLASKDDAGKANQIAQRMAQLQKDSEEVRWQYAAEGQPNQVEPEDPPRGSAPSTPVTTNGDPRRPVEPGHDGQPQAPGGSQLTRWPDADAAGSDVAGDVAGVRAKRRETVRRGAVWWWSALWRWGALGWPIRGVAGWSAAGRSTAEGRSEAADGPESAAGGGARWWRGGCRRRRWRCAVVTVVAAGHRGNGRAATGGRRGAGTVDRDGCRCRRDDGRRYGHGPDTCGRDGWPSAGEEA